jgi:peptidoglycan/LPS O-acetylase OafA/YrhL
MSEKKLAYLPELDLLRAGAFFAVFLSHWVPPDFDYYVTHHMPRIAAHTMVAVSYAGADGVMLFFCLSSYLITQLLLREIATRGRIDVGAFYMRRVLRIWPLYLTFTALALVMPFIDQEQHFGGWAGLAFVFFGGNWIWSAGFPVETIALPLWSISVEEQFYLCWPWIVRRATRHGLRNTALALFLLSACNRVFVVTHVVPLDLWHNTFTQLDAIGFGALLAIESDNPRLATLRRVPRLLLIGGGILGVFLCYLIPGARGPVWPSFFYYPIVALLCALVLFGTVGARVSQDSALIRTGLYLGKISYGLYTVHYFSLYLIGKFLASLPSKPHFLVTFLTRGTAALVLTVILASLSYRYLERPFLRLKSRFG